MKPLSSIFSLVYFSIFLKQMNGYLLFAANLDDFDTIAKKLMPDEFSDNIKKIITNPTAVRDRDDVYATSAETDRVYELRESNANIRKGDKKNNKLSKIHLNGEATIDFDELVERVKKRIEVELEDKMSAIKHGKREMDNTKKNKIKYLTTLKHEVTDDRSDYVGGVTDDRPTKLTTNSHILSTIADYSKYEYADALAITKDRTKSKHGEINTKERDYDEFKKIEMSKNDSYEDYDPPKKDTDIYSGRENKRFKIKKSTKSKEVVRKPLKLELDIDKSTHGEPGEEDVKARTENIFYDDYLTASSVKKVNLGSFRPTRERYTIVTPNYVSPMGAEKYDFDEPLPERDRQRETLKYYGNPPARVNKKVLL